MRPLFFLFFVIGTVNSFRTASFHRVQPWRRREVTILDVATQTTALRQSRESLQFIILGGTGDLSMSKILPSLFDLYTREYHGSDLVTNASSFLVQLVARSDWSTPILQATLMDRLTLPPDSTHYQSIEAKRAFVQRCSYVRVSSYHSAELAEAVLIHPTASSNLTAESSTSTLPAAADSAFHLTNNCTDTETNTVIDGTADEHTHPRHRRIVYFSLPPAQYLPVLRALHRHPPVKSDGAQSNLPVKSDRAQSNLLELVLEKPVGADEASARVILQVTTTPPR